MSRISKQNIKSIRVRNEKCQKQEATTFRIREVQTLRDEKKQTPRFFCCKNQKPASEHNSLFPELQNQLNVISAISAKSEPAKSTNRTILNIANLQDPDY